MIKFQTINDRRRKQLGVLVAVTNALFLFCFDLLGNLTQLLNAAMIFVANYYYEYSYVRCCWAREKSKPATIIVILVGIAFGILCYLRAIEVMKASFIEAATVNAVVFMILSKLMGKTYAA